MFRAIIPEYCHLAQMHSNNSNAKTSLRLAAVSAAAAGVLQATAFAAPTPMADTLTPLSASRLAYVYQPWRPNAASERAAPLWLGGSRALPFELAATAPATGDWFRAPAAPLSPATFDVAGAPPAAGAAAFSTLILDTARPAAAPIDISMKPLADSSDVAPSRLQPAIYTRPSLAPSSVERRLGGPVVGQAGAPDIFGSVALLVGRTPEDAKWRRVAEYVPPAGAGPWSTLIARVRRQSIEDQLASVNAWVNHAISYAPDLANYGVADYWGTARESLTRGRGDCKDYAIAKMELLRALGVPSDDLYLVLVKDLVRRQDHAVLAVRVNQRFVVLDSGFDGVMDSEDARDYRPILTYSAGRTWVHGFRRSPDVMVASAMTSTPDGLATQ